MSVYESIIRALREKNRRLVITAKRDGIHVSIADGVREYCVYILDEEFVLSKYGEDYELCLAIDDLAESFP